MTGIYSWDPWSTIYSSTVNGSVMGNLQVLEASHVQPTLGDQVGILVALPVVHFLAADFAWELFKEHDTWRVKRWGTRRRNWFCRGLTMKILKIPRVGYA